MLAISERSKRKALEKRSAVDASIVGGLKAPQYKVVDRYLP
jgi:hypothetical protein